MDDSFDNPFSVTRAADFTDEQIFQYWVDLAGGDGFLGIIQPRLEMPMLVLGGKGSGKTHIMRYLSLPLQRMRHATDVPAGIRRDGFLGIYMRCSGLNSARFRGKRQSDDTWAEVFAYYLDLWLSQMAVDACCDVIKDVPLSPSTETAIIVGAKDLFDAPAADFPDTLEQLGRHLRDLQRELDVAINNCVITGTLDITIRATSGKLIFGVPQVLSTEIPALRNLLFVYLIDEFENLTEPQQKRVNTLIREKENPCSFKVGSRLYGMRTYSTFCADEDNKAGSEFEPLVLDERLRGNETQYATFARRLVIRRLATRGMLSNPPDTDEEMKEYLSKAFAQVATDGLAEEATRFVLTKYVDRERPYFKSLRQVLEQGIRSKATPGLTSFDDIAGIIERVACPAFPLLEKLNCFILYQQWSANRDLRQSAASIFQECNDYLRERDTHSQYHDKLLHWKYDLLAQLRRECLHKQQYAGFDTFIELSWGNPRNLLILLKHVMSWAAFRDERLFGDTPVSVKAQSAGAKDAADWFFRDARMTGRDGKLLQDAIGRLGTLFRSIRYSHKPSECSLSAFSYEPASISDETRRLIDLAEKWMLIVYVGGQSDKNSERVDMKFQLNRMLAPKWDVSSSRRGAIVLPGDDLNTIFDPSCAGQFEQMLKVRIDRMTAPYFDARTAPRASTSTDMGAEQGTLFEMDDD